jgi:hypothetical protein
VNRIKALPGMGRTYTVTGSSGTTPDLLNQDKVLVYSKLAIASFAVVKLQQAIYVMR